MKKSMKKLTFTICCLIISFVIAGCNLSETSKNPATKNDTSSQNSDPTNDIITAASEIAISNEEAAAIRKEASASSVQLTPAFNENMLYQDLSKEQQKVVLALESQIKNYPDTFAVFDAAVTPEEAMAAAWRAYYSHPEWFWITSRLWYYTNAGRVYKIEFDFYECDTNRFHATMNELANKANLYATTLEKIVFLHDAVCEAVRYDYDLSDDNLMFNQTTYSFVTGKTVCAGYARAFSYLMNKIGLSQINYHVSSGTHAFNYVKVENSWYMVDCTWDDSETGQISRSWLLTGSETVAKLDSKKQHTPKYNYPILSKKNHAVPSLNSVTATPTPKPTTPTPKPATPTPRPSTPTPKPATPTLKPATPTPRPSTPTPKPATPTPKPATPTPKPATPTPRPSTPTPKPATPTPRPSTPTPKPATPTPKPATPTPTPVSYTEFSSWSTEKPENKPGRIIETRNKVYGYYMQTYVTMNTNLEREYRNYSVEKQYSKYNLRPSYGEHAYSYYMPAEVMKTVDTAKPGTYVSIPGAPNTAGWAKGTSTPYIGWNVENCLVWYCTGEDKRTEYRFKDIR